jgi:hypothetical protein
MRLLTLFVLCTAACGTDTGDVTTEEDVSDDGGGGGGSTTMPPGDGPAAGDPICRDAGAHSDLGWLQAHVFTPSCATAMCHGAEHASVGLSLAEGETYGNLVNHQTSTADGWIRVVPGSRTESYLLVALGREDGPMPEDGYMPLGSPALCNEKLQAIERWVTAGAQPD